MALTMKDTGLVSGVEMQKAPLTAVKALRGFVDEQGQSHATGEIVLCSERFARGLLSNGKAERAELPKEPALASGLAIVADVREAEGFVIEADEPTPAPPEPKKRKSKFAKGSE